MCYSWKFQNWAVMRKWQNFIKLTHLNALQWTIINLLSELNFMINRYIKTNNE